MLSKTEKVFSPAGSVTGDSSSDWRAEAGITPGSGDRLNPVGAGLVAVVLNGMDDAGSTGDASSISGDATAGGSGVVAAIVGDDFTAASGIDVAGAIVPIEAWLGGSLKTEAPFGIPTGVPTGVVAACRGGR